MDYVFGCHQFRVDGDGDHFICTFAASYHSDSSKHVILKEDTDMSDKVFIKILVSIVAAGVFITAFHAACRKDNANPNVSKLVDWLLSKEGQKLIEECGYVAINPIN